VLVSIVLITGSGYRPHLSQMPSGMLHDPEGFGGLALPDRK